MPRKVVPQIQCYEAWSSIDGGGGDCDKFATYDDLEELLRDVRAALRRRAGLDLNDHLRPNCPERMRGRYGKALALLSEGS